MCSNCKWDRWRKSSDSRRACSFIVAGRYLCVCVRICGFGCMNSICACFRFSRSQHLTFNRSTILVLAVIPFGCLSTKRTSTNKWNGGSCNYRPNTTQIASCVLVAALTMKTFMDIFSFSSSLL